MTTGKEYAKMVRKGKGKRSQAVTLMMWFTQA